MHSLRILLTECRIFPGTEESGALSLHQTLLKDSVESSKAFHGLHNHRNGIRERKSTTLCKSSRLGRSEIVLLYVILDNSNLSL